MKFSKPHATVTLAMLAAIVAPTSAQTAPQKTPENAHRFLQEALKAANFGYAASSIETVETADCRTLIRSVEMHGTKSRLEAVFDWSKIPSISIKNYGEASNLIFSNSPSIYVRNLNGSTSYTINHYGKIQSYENAPLQVNTGKDIAVRLQAAMEVIRDSCDKTKSTGF